VTLDVSAYLWDSLDVGLNLQLLDPKTKANEPLLGLLPGDRLPFSAKEKGSIWAEYTFPGELAGGHVYTRLQWTYTGNSLNGLPTPILDDAGNVIDIVDPDLQPAYQITDFKIGLSAADWEVYAYVDNLFDERAICSTSSPSSGCTPTTCGTGQRPAHLGRRIHQELGERPLTTSKQVRPSSERVRVRRLSKRGHYDRATIDAILDEGTHLPCRLRACRRAGRDPDAVLARGRLALPARVGRKPHARRGTD
jgi:hypothetical protein